MAKVLRFPRKSKALEKRDALVEQHLPLVRVIAKSLARTLPPSFDVDDLESAGFLALLGLAERYDALKNDSFALYARTRIRGAMLDSVKRKRWTAATMEPLEVRQPGETVVLIRNEAATHPTVEADLDQERANAALWALVGELPERSRMVVQLRYRDGLTVARAADLMGMSNWWVIQTSDAALAQLRALATAAGLKAA